LSKAHKNSNTIFDSNFLYDLAVLIEAGLPVADAAAKVTPSTHRSAGNSSAGKSSAGKKATQQETRLNAQQNQWNKVIKQLHSGSALSAVLTRAKLITPFETEIIQAAEFSGRLAQGLRHIGQIIDQRQARASQLKSKLLLPFAIFLVGVIVSSIIHSINQPEVSLGQTLFYAVITIFIVLMLTQKIISLASKEAAFWLNALTSFKHNPHYQMLFEQVVLSALHWQIKSGVDLKTGLSKISKLLAAKSLQQSLTKASRFCGQGLSLQQSFEQAKLPISPQAKQILHTAESSGQLELALEKYLLQQGILSQQKLESLYEWLPRFYYGVVAIYAITVIL
jgi:type II secretory pathway component PulF